ncbi:MAG TPA: CDP-alcohol phosphatidyltransferase family protein [Candidatus Saccharimonadales bacterium]|nr:CDP-alcohol phosphatidyltransferase family protein [Candidatus Saccharimonadales bacterium]
MSASKRSPHQFKNVLVFCNPTSTNAQKVPSLIDELHSVYPSVSFDIIQTTAGGREANKDLLAKYIDKLGPQSLLCVAGGDGTVNVAVDALLLDERFKGAARKTPILPLWGGNANDLAIMLNGLLLRTNLTQVLREASITPIWPIECSVKNKNGILDQYIAVCYASFGASAFTARWLDERRDLLASSSRSSTLRRLIREVLAVKDALISAPSFEIQERHLRRSLYERTFINGPRFAKVWGVTVKLTDRHFFMVTVEHKSLTALLQQIRQLFNRHRADHFIRQRATFRALEQIWAQFDGETIRIAADAEIDITFTKNPLYTVNTKLSPNAVQSTDSGGLSMQGTKYLVVNLITTLRMICGLAAIGLGISSHWLAVLIVAMIAFASDAFDGWLARYWHVASDAGSFMDPLADKVVCQVLLWLLAFHFNSPIFFVVAALLLAYDVIMTWARIRPARSRTAIPASWYAKVKTATEMIGLLTLLLAIVTATSSWSTIYRDIGTFIIVCSVFLAAVSLRYYVGAWRE